MEKAVILTPESGAHLVWREAASALERLGFSIQVREVESISPQGMARLFALPPERSGMPAHPSLFFCINFRGLDAFGESFSVLQRHGVPVAVWCVDNPWNLLSGLRSDFWKALFLFVTDASFIPALKAHGARHVAHLPLAADAESALRPIPAASLPALGGAVAFVGRSAFPDKERFFTGQRIPEEMLRAAVNAMEENGERPDFSWWLDALAVDATRLWPGSAARRASLGAEECSLAWKTACLREAAPSGLTVYGDAGWRDVFPPDGGTSLTLCPPIDYYGKLRGIYAATRFSLNMMSLLLPHGLNQRHFDVWTAGGFCIMDSCPGLALFPDELTGPVTFGAAREIPGLIAAHAKDAPGMRSLADRWREHILEEHTYDHRMRHLTKCVFP